MQNESLNQWRPAYMVHLVRAGNFGMLQPTLAGRGGSRHQPYLQQGGCRHTFCPWQWYWLAQHLNRETCNYHWVKCNFWSGQNWWVAGAMLVFISHLGLGEVTDLWWNLMPFHTVADLKKCFFTFIISVRWKVCCSSCSFMRCIVHDTLKECSNILLVRSKCQSLQYWNLPWGDGYLLWSTWTPSTNLVLAFWLLQSSTLIQPAHSEPPLHFTSLAAQSWWPWQYLDTWQALLIGPTLPRHDDMQCSALLPQTILSSCSCQSISKSCPSWGVRKTEAEYTLNVSQLQLPTSLLLEQWSWYEPRGMDGTSLCVNGKFA